MIDADYSAARGSPRKVLINWRQVGGEKLESKAQEKINWQASNDQKCIKDSVDKEIQEEIKRSLHVQFKWYVDWFLFSHTGHICRGKEGTPWQDTAWTKWTWNSSQGHCLAIPRRSVAVSFLHAEEKDASPASMSIEEPLS